MSVGDGAVADLKLWRFDPLDIKHYQRKVEATDTIIIFKLIDAFEFDYLASRSKCTRCINRGVVHIIVVSRQ